MLKARAIALYLPQFHPIPENDEWWGKGFTEWTNTAKAKPLFRGHYQPHVPADLGFYDLRVPETRQAQADMAHAHGIEGFCYYHYWFAGRRLLHRVFDEVLASGAPDFPFCLCWANETWSGVWHGAPNQVLVQQTYPGDDDHRAHFDRLAPAFHDPRHMRVDGKPIFVIYQPRQIPDAARTMQLWRELAARSGLPGLHLVANSTRLGEDLRPLGFDTVMRVPHMKEREWLRDWSEPLTRLRYALDRRLGRPLVRGYARWAERFAPRREDYPTYPCVVHAWDNTPRSGANGVAFRDPDPEAFRSVLSAALTVVADQPPERRVIFLKSWNEWAEGNHLEPDLRYGLAYLRVLAEALGA